MAPCQFSVNGKRVRNQAVHAGAGEIAAACYPQLPRIVPQARAAGDANVSWGPSSVRFTRKMGTTQPVRHWVTEAFQIAASSISPPSRGSSMLAAKA